MGAHYPVPKYLLYGLLIVGSWLLSCLLHFHFFHLSASSSFLRRGAATLVVLPIALDARLLTPSDDGAGVHGRRPSSQSPSPSPSCEGRFVHILNVPARFDVLGRCVEGSPEFENEYSVCVLMSNAGLGPVLPPPAGNGSDGDSGIIPPTRWYKTDQYSLEVIFHNRMRQYECLTDDPAAATAVYVPYYPGLELQLHLCGFNTTVRDGPSSEFLRWLSSRPEWGALGGRDHFIVAAKTTWMFRRVPGSGGETDQGCGNNFLDHAEPANMTVLTYESNLWVRRDFAVPYPSYFHPSSAGEVAAWQARARRAHRPLLYAFAGARRAKGTVAIRDAIIDGCAAAASSAGGRGRCGMLDCSHGLEGSIMCRTPRKLVSLFASARFCLQPPGDSYMRRSSVDAVMAGCVPVFFHDSSAFKKQYLWHEPSPENDADDHRRYSVFINPDDVLEGKVSIEEALSRYSDEEVAAMREEVIRMIPRFLYKDPRVRFEGGMRDAFDITIDEVLARMRRIKNGEDLGWKDDDADGAAVHAKDS